MGHQQLQLVISNEQLSIGENSDSSTGCLSDDVSESNGTFSIESVKASITQLHDFMSTFGDGLDWNSVADNVKESLTSSMEVVKAIRKLQEIIDTASPDSIGHEILEESHDSRINPEIALNPTHVRISEDLSSDEKKFRHRRLNFIRSALAKYLDISESHVDERDIPVIAIAGSGGGYRAMVATSGFLKAAESSGLLDCVTYLAGISGSTWLLSAYYTIANCNFEKLLNHYKSSTGVHIAFLPAVLELVTKEPTSAYLLRGLIEKQSRRFSDITLSDIYGILLCARLMVPDDKRLVDHAQLKISNQRIIVDTGVVPMPIYNAVRHKIVSKENTDSDSKKDQSSLNQNTGKKYESSEPTGSSSSFQYFEFTPYEVGCEEIGGMAL